MVFRTMSLLKRQRRKGLVLLAIICISSSTLVKLCIQGEKMYEKYHEQTLIPVDRIAERNVLNVTRTAAATAGPHAGPLCAEQYCKEFLSLYERILYKQCTQSAFKHVTLDSSSSTSCQFINGNKRGPIALASFPGSGNTWVRGLLQLATGMCTGSIYCDRDLRRNGFIGEGISTGSVLVTKTHKTNSKNIRRNQLNHPKLNFTSAIFIVRNPFNAIVSERSRQISIAAPANESKGAHVDIADKDSFGSNEKWSQFVEAKVRLWKRMVQFWLLEWPHPVLVVSYEELRHDTVHQIKRMIDFIEYQQLNEDELRIKLKNGYSTYHRRHHNFNYYTNTQIKTINHHIQQADSELKKNNKIYNNISLISYLQQTH